MKFVPRKGSPRTKLAYFNMSNIRHVSASNSHSKSTKIQSPNFFINSLRPRFTTPKRFEIISYRRIHSSSVYKQMDKVGKVGKGAEHAHAQHSHEHQEHIMRDETQAASQEHQHKQEASDHSHTHKQEASDHSHTHKHSSVDEHEDSEHHSHSHDSLSMLSHTHSHHQPNELLSSSFSNPAVRITWIGLFVNIGLAISKAVGGVYFHSQSLIADAIHSLSDMVADFLTLATVNVAAKVGSADRFPLGYGKLESIGSLLVSGVLLFAGISVGWSSLLSVFEYTLPTYLYEFASRVQIGHSHSHSFDLGPSSDMNTHSHSHGHGDVNIHDDHVTVSDQKIPDINAAWLAGGSIVIKEFLFRRTMKIANQTNSKVLVANAWHHRVDSLTALVAVVTVTGGNLFNVVWLDSVGGLLVSALIIRAGWGSFKSAFYELVDRGEGISTEESSKVRDLINVPLTDEQFKILNLSVLLSGANTNVFMTLVASEDNQSTLEHLNELEEKIIKSIKSEDKFIRNVFIQFKTLDKTSFDNLSVDDINK